MAFAYTVAAGVNYATSSSANTEDAYLAMRQANNRQFAVYALFLTGKAAAATVMNSIVHRMKRWTTAGSGGTTLTPSPSRIGTTANTVVADKQSALTPGTVSGALQLAIGHSATGPGGWVARDNMDAEKVVEGGTADELDLYSATAASGGLNFEASLEFNE